jgi:cytidyltransferase-like protein
MNKRYRRGLVVGKFCPLHRGHEFLIQRAQAECDDVLVVSYTKPGFDGYDCARREQWIRTLFPELQVLCLDDARLATACAKQGFAQRALPFDTDEDRAHREFVA